MAEVPKHQEATRDLPNDSIEQKPYAFQFKKLPTHLGADLRESFWGVQGLYFLTAMGASMAWYPLDQEIADYFSSSPWFSSQLNRSWGHVSSPFAIGGSLFLTWGAAYWTQNKKLAVSMEAALEAWGLSMAMVAATKFATGRTRPDGSSYSFPSAHTASIFSTATVLANFYGYSVGIPAYALSVFTALTRMDGNKHFLTDVLVGAVLGTAIGIGTSKAHRGEKQYSVMPWISTDGVGLSYEF